MFVEKLTDKQIYHFLVSVYPINRYNCKFSKEKGIAIILANCYSKNTVWESEWNIKYSDFWGTKYNEEWVKFLYKIFGEEYKKEYLKECAKIFEKKEEE